MDKKIKTFEELETDKEKLNQSMMEHQKELDASREIDLDRIRKLLKFYNVRLHEISDSLASDEQGQDQAGGSDYWSRRK
jgi:hypothetical protein